MTAAQACYISGNNNLVLGQNQWRFKVLFLGLSAHSTAADSFAIKFGFYDQGVFNDDASGWRDVAFCYNYNANQASQNWQCLTRDGNGGGGRTLTASTVPVALTPGNPPDGVFTQQLLEINYDGDGSQHGGTPTVEFQIDGTLVATHTTHIPNLADWQGHIALTSQKFTHSGTANYAAFDYLWSKLELPAGTRKW